VLTLLYQFGFDRIDRAMLSSPLGARIVVAWLLLAPLGFCLGLFMPLGLTCVATLTPLGDEYVAWAWAVNGFASVIGSVLTTILAMSFGFRTVQFAALGVYVVALLAYTRLRAVANRRAVEPEFDPSSTPLTPLAARS
jgi:MFS family permease